MRIFQSKNIPYQHPKNINSTKKMVTPEEAAIVKKAEAVQEEKDHASDNEVNNSNILSFIRIFIAILFLIINDPRFALY